MPRPGAARTRRDRQLHLERFGARRRLMLLGVGRRRRRSSPRPASRRRHHRRRPDHHHDDDQPPPPAICGVTASSAGAAAAGAGRHRANGTADSTPRSSERDGRSQVLTRTVDSPAELAQFRADAAAQGEVLSFAPDGEVQAIGRGPDAGASSTRSSPPRGTGTPTPTNGPGVRVAELDTGIDTPHPDLAGHFDGRPVPTSSSRTRRRSSNHRSLRSTRPRRDHRPVDQRARHARGRDPRRDRGQRPRRRRRRAGRHAGPRPRARRSNGSGTYSDVAAGILWAADVTKGNAQVITMSLGGADDQRRGRRAAIGDRRRPDQPQLHAPGDHRRRRATRRAASTQFPASLGDRPRRRCSRCRRCARSGVTGVVPDRATPWPADGAVQAGDVLVARVERLRRHRRGSPRRAPTSTRPSPVAATGSRAARRWRRRSSPPPPRS